MSKEKKRRSASNSIQIVAIDKNGNQSKYESMLDAAKDLGIFINGISRVRDTKEWYRAYQFKTYRDERTKD